MSEFNQPQGAGNSREEIEHHEHHGEDDTAPAGRKLDLPAVRELLEKSHGREYWRSLEDLAQTDAFQDLMHREFPRYASEWEDGDSRRNFIKLMGASLALAGLTACTRQPTELIAPYIRQPEELVPGRPLFFASAMPLASGANGVLVESHEGRPTKIEGNPDHPASLGAADVYTQASVLGLYDPDRSQALTLDGEIRSWGAFLGAIQEAINLQRAKRGAGLRLLTGTVTSPTLAAQIKQMLADFPQAKWHQWEPVARHSATAGAVLAFGQPVNTTYDFSAADVIVSLDADFLSSGPGSLRYARQFAAKRRVRGNQTDMSRLYVVEPMPSPTGTKADHRMPLRAADVEQFAWSLASALGVETGGRKGTATAADKWIAPLVRDLQNHKGASVVIAGEYQSPGVHALAHAMNASLGNVGKTVFYTDTVEAEPADQVGSLYDLVKDLDAGAVDLLLVLGGNFVYDAPVELGFKDRLKKAQLRVHLSLQEDETSQYCQWHLPMTHYLETWSDCRAHDGTVTIMQPLIAPLYAGKSAHEVLAMLTNKPEQSSYDIVKGYWAAQHKGADFETWWRKAVHDGVMADTALPAKTAALRTGWAASVPQPAPAQGLEVVFRPDPAVYDGRFANNGWLQEFPRPITQLTWDNAAIMSPRTAQEKGVVNADLVEIAYRGYKMRAPVFIQPGHADGSVTVHLGYGRTRAGHVGTRIGFNVYGMRTSHALWQDYGLDVRKVGSDYLLVSIQDYHALDTERHTIEKANIAEYRKNPNLIQEDYEQPAPGLTLYPGFKYDKYAWGMGIDLSACMGCGACVVACQAENNIAVVGKEEVHHGRHMHWLRVDSYFHGDVEAPEIYNQPVPCQQCENAPCELVCPVQATNHSSEGLNDMVYNRCVGTRYCSNNCPYKVRRFNFFLFSDWTTPSLKLQRNPDVSVRSRGVMEKCTYCVQRINRAKIDAEKENRVVRDGEIQTACQATCPTQAIIFGNINDPNSRVAKMKSEKTNYGLLADLNTRPRTSYLAALRNPNPEIES
ncbi:MAG TPA: TAT-variant-translocated molybdopterin oxidoreductase [Bryobacteraceae bacterium]|nr:TAT-variant-translocated molybdopterin oxidoreductase [Bryobacteraceae bacterium]